MDTFFVHTYMLYIYIKFYIHIFNPVNPQPETEP